MIRARQTLLTAAFFVCPLLFFTNLTRNPYITQIGLLNVLLVLAAAAWALDGARRGVLEAARTPLDAPLAGWAAACGLSFLVAYYGHLPYFRPAMASEGAKGFLFLLANCLLPYGLAGLCLKDEGGAGEPSPAPWAAFAVVWGLLWTLLPQLRAPLEPAGDIWGQVWDGYGAFLWLGGLAVVLWLCRRGRWADYLHLAFAVGFMSAGYAVCQYFNVEFIWPNVLNPYGGRSVSTFGNPNFMSSFDVMLLPAAAAYFARSRGGARLVYGALLLALEAALLCSLTRSSWLGAVAGLAALAASERFRRDVEGAARPSGLLLAAGLAMALLWPQSTISSGYTPSVIGRLREVGLIMKPGEAYSPWHQRVLIWACAWTMGSENPLTGKGWGLFEVFYPFYQGHLLNTFDFFRLMRTHANNAHNEVLEAFSQTGLLGLGAVVWIWTSFFAAARRTLLGRDPDMRRVAAAAGVAGMLVDNLLNVSLHFAVPGFLFWWLAGTAMAAPEGAPRRISLARPGARACALALAAALAAAPWYWVRVWNREARYFAGFKLLRQGAVAGGIAELEASRAWGPREVNALYELGNAYARAERFPEAARAYSEALDANAGYDEIYFNLGTVLGQRLGRRDDAVAQLRMALWINPLAREVYRNLGDIYVRFSDRYLEDGIALLTRAVHFFPEDAAHWNNLGYLLTLARRYDDAELAYARALSVDPNLAPAQKNLAALRARTGRRGPPLADALASLRELEARLSRRDYSDETFAMAERLAGRFPDLPKARFYWGTLLLTRGRNAEAVPQLEWVVAREPRLVSARLNLAHAYLTLGRKPDAVREYQAAQALAPADPRVQEQLKALGL